MRLIDVFGIAFSTFIHNRMRTFLTIFGISIGIGAIVFLLSLGYGIQKTTIGEISNMKALSTINVTSGNSSILDMTDNAVEKFRKIEGVTMADPNLAMSGQISYGSSRTDALVSAVSAQYAELDSPSLESGKLYADSEKDSIVLTKVIANVFNLEPGKLIGQKVKLSLYIPNPENEKEPIFFEKEFTVTGVIKENSASYVYAPIDAFTYPKGTKFSAIKLKVDDLGRVKDVKTSIVGMGYKASSVGEKIDQMNSIFNTVKIVLLILGAIGLFVASIGMFNTLTISLLERTKDIGIMKSLGATDGGIYAVFLTEATLIALIGGISGILGAIILGNLLNFGLSVIAVRAGGSPVAIFETPIMLTISILAFSLLVGFLTGFYPARRAARLNPLDALRYE